MPKFISLEAAEQAICEVCERPGCPKLWGHCCNRMDRLNAIQAADVRPVVRARWYWDNYRYDWCCSNCFHPADHRIDKNDAFKEPSFPFCPHCGADMREPIFLQATIARSARGRIRNE